jgi:hypothetical protein
MAMAFALVGATVYLLFRLVGRQVGGRGPSTSLWAPAC